MTRILGIDPGLQHTGWGIIESHKNQLSFVDCGVVDSDVKLEISSRLKQLHDGIEKVIARYKPDEAAVEETFINKNNASSLKLGHARGAVLLSLSLSSLPVYEYSTNLIKKSVVGRGHADKTQVAMMVKTLLPASQERFLEKKLGADASDALAAAITHAHHRHLTIGLK
jgi:crossover junction endodeoxyribonuclease RuvC